MIDGVLQGTFIRNMVDTLMLTNGVGAFVGFTAATGYYYAEHHISSWTFTETPCKLNLINPTSLLISTRLLID